MAKKKASEKKSTLLRRRYTLFTALVALVGAAIVGYMMYQFYFSVWQHNIKEKKLEVTSLTPDEEKLLHKKKTPKSFRVPILMYHYVEYVTDKNDTIRESLNIKPHAFEAQVKTLKDAGYTFLYASDLGKILDGKKELPEKPVILTFDDGYLDFYTDVLPILKKHKAKAVVYIVPGVLDKPNFMYTSQVQEVAKSGLVEIGAHTVNHRFLKGLLEKTAWDEIIKSKQLLETMFHVPVVSFAYPYGAFDAQAITLVKKAGFTTGVSTLPGIEVNKENRYFLFRIRPGYRTGDDLLNYLEGTHFIAY